MMVGRLSSFAPTAVCNLLLVFATLVIVVAIASTSTVSAVDAAIPMMSSQLSLCTPSCCNYCNETFHVGQSCQLSYQSVLNATKTTPDFSYASSSSDDGSAVYVSAVHKTVSDCCPPGFVYHEDVRFDFTHFDEPSLSSDPGCVLIGYSKSRKGACDLGNDQANLNKLLAAAELDVYFSTVNSGCQGTSD
eukprot:CAMPEP_0174229614 /NCGR_PEP_ID=MMETSP0417-20130205/525_1 /TAXON_ID=242541 /ORGANISM="Mayorella sp, Strain BSH-02190019" /LENGTH=189 /DNA_ID=CAMNT_0015307175 /DNA_START=29 /DNA_END=598 /DNA_ORIENTATION=+